MVSFEKNKTWVQALPIIVLIKCYFICSQVQSRHTESVRKRQHKIVQFSQTKIFNNRQDFWLVCAISRKKFTLPMLFAIALLPWYRTQDNSCISFLVIYHSHSKKKSIHVVLKQILNQKKYESIWIHICVYIIFACVLKWEICL